MIYQFCRTDSMTIDRAALQPVRYYIYTQCTIYTHNALYIPTMYYLYTYTLNALFYTHIVLFICTIQLYIK